MLFLPGIFFLSYCFSPPSFPFQTHIHHRTAMKKKWWWCLRITTALCTLSNRNTILWILGIPPQPKRCVQDCTTWRVFCFLELLRYYWQTIPAIFQPFHAVQRITRSKREIAFFSFVCHTNNYHRLCLLAVVVKFQGIQNSGSIREWMNGYRLMFLHYMQVRMQVMMIKLPYI